MRIELEVCIFYSEQRVCTEHVHLDETCAHPTDRIVSARKWSQRSNRENAVTLYRVSVIYIPVDEFHII